MYLIFFYRNTSEKRRFTVIQGQEVIFRRFQRFFMKKIVGPLIGP